MIILRICPNAFAVQSMVPPQTCTPQNALHQVLIMLRYGPERYFRAEVLTGVHSSAGIAVFWLVVPT